MAQNEVMRLREQIRLESEVAERGLSGLAWGVSRHDFIEARATRGADYILQLIEEGKRDEAIALMHTQDWGCEVQDARSGVL
jgi:uncharacterized protein YjiK